MEENKENAIRPRLLAVWINLLVILFVAVAGMAIAYFSIAIFTKHGQETTVPKVENMSYTQAVELLHSQGFNVDIRDSVFRDDVKPGYVIEQFPRANSVVKPGRKIFLYINAVHPKEVMIDDGPNKDTYALRNWSLRQVKARLAELGFKNVKTKLVRGEDDRVVRITAGGNPIYQMQKVAVNLPIIIEVSDGRLGAIRDSLYDTERLREYQSLDFDESQEEWEVDREGVYPREDVEYYDDPTYTIPGDDLDNDYMF